MIHRWRMRPLFGDTDAMGVVYYGNYMRYFERGRAELMRSAGKAYAEMADQGLHLPVTEAYIKYKSPAHYDEDIIVETTLSWVKKASMRFDYRVLLHDNGKEKELVAGHTVHACVDTDGKISRLPQWLTNVAQKPT